MLTKDQKQVLRVLVKRELDHFTKEKNTIFLEMYLPFLKAEHQVEDFLKELLKALDHS